MKNLLAETKLDPIRGLGGYDPDPSAGAEAYLTQTEAIISNTLTVLTIVGGIMFAVFFVSGALNWITAGGEQQKIEKAKGMMTSAAIGLIIISLSYSITYIISQVVGINILSPKSVILNLF